MNKKLLIVLLLLISTFSKAQQISFTIVNARNTNDGTNDFYEADIYITSDTAFKLGSGQIYFTYNTAAFGANIHTNGSFSFLQPTGSILAEVYGFPAYKDFIVNDNTSGRVSTSFQQGVSSGTITANNVTTTAKHLCSIKIKYQDKTQDPTVAFETGTAFLDQFFTACGPATFGFPDCTNSPGTQIFGDSFDSSGATIKGSHLWSGTSDTSWTNTANWSTSSIPTATDNVELPNVATTPIIGTGVLAKSRDLKIHSGSALQLTNNGTLEVAGTFTNEGTLTMISSVNASPTLLVTGSATGMVTYERGGLMADKWSIITAPVHGQSIKEFVENASNDIRKNTTVSPHQYAVAYYDDSRAVGTKWVYYTVDDLTTNSIQFEKGRSYAISRGTDGGVSFTGTVETADVNRAVTGGAWNAIGNPFTAFLPVNENSGTNFITTNLANLDPMYAGIYVWDNAQHKYVVSSLASGERALAPGQGFFVKTATSASSVSFNQAQRVMQPATGGAFQRQQMNSVEKLELNITSKSRVVSTVIAYHQASTNGLDVGYDVGNFDANGLDLYSRLVDGSSENNFTHQYLPMTSADDEISLGVVAEQGAQVSISLAKGTETISREVYLEDRLLGKYVNLKKEDYSLVLTEGAKGVGRFYLHTKKEELQEEALDDYTISYTDGILRVQGSANSPIHLSMYSITGAEIIESTALLNTDKSIVIKGIAVGVYIVKISTENGVKTQKIVLKH